MDVSVAVAAPAATIVTKPYAGVDWTTHIVLTTDDDVHFAVSRKAMSLSKVISDMLADVPDSEEVDIPLRQTAETMRYVIEYVEYHKDVTPDQIPSPLPTPLSSLISEWSKRFLYTDLVRGGDDREHRILLNVLSASHFLHIEPLLDLTCACVGSMIQGKSPRQIRELLHIPNDFTEEQELQNEKELKALSEL